ncbi:porin [Plesiomonas shigelloides]|uniref:porin n=1 Tax=Plesiomonas shigelloides TaxID=703 RepID=UPI00126211F5|nr:porin [Plesiomonas shigelloides]KAB7696755.1 porin [Plesiomonas shigelloides]
MKRTVLAAMIPALLVAGAANAAVIYDQNNNKLDLYGSITGDYHFAGNHNAKNVYQRGDASYVRLGLKGTTQINNELQGFGRVEYNMAPNAEDNFNGPNQIRLAYVGLKNDRYGSISYGRNWGVMYDITSFTDVLPEWGEDTQGYTQVSTNNASYAATMFGTGRSDSVLQYRNSWNGFNLGLQYLGANKSYGDYNADAHEFTPNSEGYGVTAENGDGYGISMSYDTDMGITLGAAYNNARKTDDQTQKLGLNDKNAQMWTLGAKYDANNIYAAINYTQTKDQLPFFNATGIETAATSQAVFAVAQYNFDNGLTPSIAYAQGWLRNPNGYVGNQNYSKYVDLALTYNFNANMNAYVDYKINLLDNNEYTANNALYTNNVAAVGLQYTF